MTTVTTEELLRELLELQRTNPYRGWDIKELNAFHPSVQKFIATTNKENQAMDKGHSFLIEFLSLYHINERSVTKNKGWKISKLSSLANQIRIYLEIPPIDLPTPNVSLRPYQIEVREHLNHISKFSFRSIK